MWNDIAGARTHLQERRQLLVECKIKSVLLLGRIEGQDGEWTSRRQNDGLLGIVVRHGGQMCGRVFLL